MEKIDGKHHFALAKTLLCYLEDKNELENSDLEDQKQNLRKSSNSSKKSEHRKSPDQNNAANANRISGQANNYGSIPQKEDDLKSVGEGEDQNVDPSKQK